MAFKMKTVDRSVRITRDKSPVLFRFGFIFLLFACLLKEDERVILDCFASTKHEEAWAAVSSTKGRKALGRAWRRVCFTVLSMRTTDPWFFNQCCLNSVMQPRKKTGTVLRSRFDCTKTKPYR